MKFSHLNRDTRAVNQDEGTYPYAKNGIIDYIRKSVLNEPGFSLSGISVPYNFIGIIETDKFPVLVTTNNTNSALGYFDFENDVYIPICDDATLPFKFNFNINHFVTGQAQRNYKGEIVVFLTDGQQEPYYVNCDAFGAPTAIEQVRFFPSARIPVITTTQQSGGSLLPGAYYFSIKYIARDGTETGAVTITPPEIVLGDTPTESTDRAIEIVMSNLDTNYDKVQLIIITKISGVVRAVQLLEPIQITTSGIYTFTGNEITEDITLEEVLIPPAVYEKVKVAGQLNDALYLADLTAPARINMQKWVNLIRLRWGSKLISITPEYTPLATGKEKSFMHREVYAMYIRFSLTRGGFTEMFHIPGNSPIGDNESPSTIASGQGVTAKKFQAEDTIPSYDSVNKTGYFGVWVNDTETYPDTDDYDSSTVGGRDLKGEKVLHHRFPSVRWCKENLYSTEPEYGRTKFDLLGINVENVVIPPEYASLINGWEIFYAKRSVSNSTVMGQSLLMFGARDQFSPEGNPATYYSTGGNFGSKIDFQSTPQRPLYLDQSIFHFHAFDVLLNRPDASPAFISLELKHRRTRIPYTDGYVEDGGINSGQNNGPLIYKLDYILNGEVPTVPSTWFKGIKETQYVPNNIVVNKWNNLWIEGYFGGRMNNYDEVIPDAEMSSHSVIPSTRGSYTPRNNAVQYETTFLSNLMFVRTNLFTPYTGQSLARAAQSQTIINSNFFYRGDTYVSDYTFHTYGRWAASGNDDIGGGPEIQGTKVARRFICETAANLYSRFQIDGNIYSKYYPVSPLSDNNEQSNYLIDYQRSQDPNQFGYSKDSNALDDIISSVIFNTFSEDLNEFPFRIHRTGKLSRQTKGRNWKTILPLDYYEGQKNMGRIVNVEGMDDRLLIHYENALMLTQDKTRLETDIIAITLGAGDIFQFQPQEALSTKLGFAGTQHRLACVRTPYGYLFVDTKENTVFAFKGTLENLNKDINTFFREHLELNDNNVFSGNGVTIGYDREYKRFLLTVKNQTLPDVYKGPTGDGVYTDSWIPLMEAGDIVYKNGTYQEFLGVNATEYSCPGAVVPAVNDLTTSCNSDEPIGTVIGTITGTLVQSFYLTTPLIGITLNSSTGQLVVSGSLESYFTGIDDLSVVLVRTIRGVSSDGSEDTGTLTLTINRTLTVPITGDQEFTTPDDVINGTVIGTVEADDIPSNLPLTFLIVDGNEAGAFDIDTGSGEISVIDDTQINAGEQTVFILGIDVTNAAEFTKHIEAKINVVPADDNAGSTLPDVEVIVFDDIATGGRVLKETEYGVPGSSVVYQIVSQSPGSLFEIDPTTKNLQTTGSLDLGTTEEGVYTIVMQANDGTTTFNYNVVVTVWHAKDSIEFLPESLSCVGLQAEYAGVEIVKTGVGTIDIKANSNVPVEWQGMDLPYYEPIVSSSFCGGTDSTNLSVAQTYSVTKNDCVGSLGVLFTYTVPKGYKSSNVSVAAANALATAYGDANKQSFVNTYGQCV